MNNKVIWIFRIVIGSLFIVSAISKLFPIEAFDLTIVNQGIANWNIAPYLSRFIIGIEFFLGISFLITPFVKKIAVPLSFFLLLVFCIHIIYLIATGNGSKNCGCFGELIVMSSLEALMKNVVLIFFLFLIYKYFKYDKYPNYSLAFAIFSILFACMFLVFQVKPYLIPQKDDVSTQNNDAAKNTSPSMIKKESDTTHVKEDSSIIAKKNATNEPKAQPVKVVSVFASFKEFSDNQIVNLDEGINLVCLFSLDCEDCMATARKLGQAKKDWGKFPPLYILFLGEEEQVRGFFEIARTNFPYKIIPPQIFFPLIKNYPPRIILLNNGNVIGDWGYENFNVEKLRANF
jgi:uncharacterized membrane protein YphA (DoxX/SURF4 family)